MSEQILGGQAVIEGVMMKNLSDIAIAVRKEDGTISVKKEKVNLWSNSFVKLPFVRGFFSLLQMMVIGMKALIWSANEQGTAEESFSKKELFFLILTSISLSVLFFVLLPYFLTSVIGFSEVGSPILFNFIDGIIKMLIFVVYIYSISLMKDIYRLFQYHGAEHKVVHCVENKLELTVENARKFSTLHPRCGTSFIIFVFIVSVLIFSVIPALLFNLFPSIIAMSFFPQKVLLFFVRIMFLPIIMGVGYEVLRFSAKYESNFLVKILIFPGLMSQKLTTKEPDDLQLEVSIAAMKGVYEQDVHLTPSVERTATYLNS